MRERESIQPLRTALKAKHTSLKCAQEQLKKANQCNGSIFAPVPRTAPDKCPKTGLHICKDSCRLSN
jgi:hypothetical protein